MSIKQIDVKEAQARLQELLSQIASGVEWILTDRLTPVACLVPISSRVAGLHTGAIWISPDFDEPLPEEFWTDNAGHAHVYLVEQRTCQTLAAGASLPSRLPERDCSEFGEGTERLHSIEF